MKIELEDLEVELVKDLLLDYKTEIELSAYMPSRGNKKKDSERFSLVMKTLSKFIE